MVTIINYDNYEPDINMIQARNEQESMKNKNMEDEPELNWILTYMELDGGNTDDLKKTEFISHPYFIWSIRFT